MLYSLFFQILYITGMFFYMDFKYFIWKTPAIYSTITMKEEIKL